MKIAFVASVSFPYSSVHLPSNKTRSCSFSSHFDTRRRWIHTPLRVAFVPERKSQDSSCVTVSKRDTDAPDPKLVDDLLKEYNARMRGKGRALEVADDPQPNQNRTSRRGGSKRERAARIASAKLATGGIEEETSPSGQIGNKMQTESVRKGLYSRPPVRQYTGPPRLRIMAGSAQGRKLDSPPYQLRPMMGKVREALFNIVKDFGIDSGAVLDLFAGSGSIGIEALSRGFDSVVFVDADHRAAEVIDQNLEKCGFLGRGKAYSYKVEQIFDDPELIGKRSGPFALVVASPPYEEIDYKVLSEALAKSGLVGPGSLVALEYPFELRSLPEQIGELELVRDRKYGRTKLAVYIYGGEAVISM